MSNSSVGSIYSKIVDEVIDNCRASFEEEGAQPNVLDDFKKEWQKKISQRKVAQMPWDPTPAPAAQNTSAAPAARPQPYTAAPAPAQPPAETRIKTEPDASYDLQDLSAAQPAAYSSSNASLAFANASQQLQEKFGDQANASIQRLNERAQEASNGTHGQKRPLPSGSPTQDVPDSKRLMTDYNSGLQAQAQAKLSQLNASQQRQPTVGAAQTDGAADWKAMVAERMSLSADDIQSADRSIMDLVRAQWQTEEGNGVMMPLSQAATKSAAGSKVAKPSAARKAGLAQCDGVDDDDEVDIKDDLDDEVDADAINSDLDDDEDDQVDDDDDDDPQQLIVCTYEKVARVKNKWKCVLKDGILITGGQEYVFTKATGEFEW